MACIYILALNYFYAIRSNSFSVNSVFKHWIHNQNCLFKSFKFWKFGNEVYLQTFLFASIFDVDGRSWQVSPKTKQLLKASQSKCKHLDGKVKITMYKLGESQERLGG